MASLRGFDRSGVQQWSVSNDGLPAGAIDYLGDNLILLANGVGLYLIRSNGKSAQLERTLEIWPAVLVTGIYDAFGIAINHTRKTHRIFDGLQCYIHFLFSIEVIGVGVLTQRQVWLYDFHTEDMGVQVFTGTFNPTPKGLAWDGKNLWLQENASPRFVQYRVSGSGIQENFAISHQYTTIDCCFDGKHLYQLSSAQVRQYNPSTISSAADYSFTHGLTDPRGITYDDKQFIFSVA